MAKKSSKPQPAVVEPVVVKKKGRRGAREETEEMKKERLLHRAKVTSTSSWTGKLPQTLLHEMCQKRKWNRVEYDIKKIGQDGMLAAAVLSYTDPKTKEILAIKMYDPTFDRKTGKGCLKPQETPMEARHMAATVALYRISSNSNMQMMLPPNHKSLWYELDDFRKSLKKENDVLAEKLFDPEPFKSLIAENKSKDVKDKERQARLQQAQKSQQVPTLITSNGAKPGKDAITKRVREPLDKKIIRFPQKVWENATFVDLKESSRTAIEHSLRSHIDWESKKWNGELTKERCLLQESLLSHGFRKRHAEEAILYKDPLSFLLFNLPEDDLPPFFHKRLEDTKMKVEISSLPLNIQNMISRLMEGGASYAESLYALQSAENDENEAAGKLTEKFLIETTATPPEISQEECNELWTQELESLLSIYGGDVIEVLKEDGTCYTIKLMEEFHLKLKVYKTKSYPFTLPGMIVSTFDKNYKLPSYIKQTILTKLVTYVIEAGLLGDMLVYHVFEWLQEHLASIIDNPGSLLPKAQNSMPSHDREVQHSQFPKSSRNRTSRTDAVSATELQQLKSEYAKRITSRRYAEMIKQRSQLPAWKIQEKIVDLIYKNDVVLITGETGSGKSTQAVQFILDYLMSKQNDYGQTKIICTQPRRISAIGLAERVSEERCSDCGNEVGYIIRGVNKTKATTRIRFMTTGVLVRILQGSRDFLANSIVFIDEVHERSVDTDLIVILLKNLRGKIPGLKIVLMSATVNVDVFKNYFGDLKTCHIEGRTFPIEDFFLEEILETLDFKIKRKNISYDDFDREGQKSQGADSDYLRPSADSKFFKSGQINYDLILSLTIHIDKKLVSESNDGSIVIFMPGVGEINNCCKNLMSGKNSEIFVVLPLHSALTPDAQKKVFKRFPGKRKIVVSTNIAETSITIDDCAATIDTGRVKTMYYNAQENTTRLIETFVSKAESNQRRGRAGRVRAGLSYKLFSRCRFDEMSAQPLAEIKRVGLESLYLSVKSMGIKDVIGFLGKGLDPPPLDSLRKSEQLLTAAGLLSEDDTLLTELGKFISLMPLMDYKHGKMLIYSIIFGCTDVGINIAAILSCNGSPFAITSDNRDQIKALCQSCTNGGDLLAYLEIVRRYLKIEDSASKRRYLNENFLSYNKMKEIISSRAQLLSILKDVGFLPMRYNMSGSGSGSDYLNRNAKNIEIIKSILTGAFYPQVARVQQPDQKFINTSAGAIEKNPEAKMIKYWIRNEKYIDHLYKLDKDSEVENTALPATRSFLHPSSVFFSPKDNNSIGELVALESSTEKSANNNQNYIKAPFIVFNSSYSSDKLFLKDVTPTTTLALLLFGGAIKFELQGTNHSPGLILDNWLPIRTWCKNGVLIKELRSLLDNVIRQKLENPQYNSLQRETSHLGDDVLTILENILKSES
ncbi:LANO_0H18756g1_1 [Lachancea nothofagi CBS 11611]|uniref:LANO_0H18756g1_1 n=1 Tax=Lachancea nothofagi CBS 11611 TaxID=1266666 RepID=A0A1G4KNE1_9SACH|nr:LANO_0H18756g1_1 [Lachancea nothofagi CBS 11611]